MIVELQRGNPFIEQAPAEQRYWWGRRRGEAEMAGQVFRKLE
jgi:hypothetical protein